MDVQENITLEVDAPASSESRNQWAEQHARQVQQLFQQWQHQIGIDGQEYRKHLAEELADYWEDPLLKSLIESII